MKTKLFTLLFAVAANIGTMFASVSIDGIDYNLNETELTAEVTYGEEYFGSVIIPDLVTYSGKSYRVTIIGEWAFLGCSGLTSVTIPNSVTSIGDYAFSGTGLTSPVYNAHVFAFMPTAYSGAYTIPDGIELIAGAAFAGCTGLTSVTIPNSVTSIGNSAFSYCSGLTSVTIPNSVTSIGYQAFSGCTGLTSLTIPNSVTSIEDEAFSGCKNITSIVWNAKSCNSCNFGAQIESFVFGDSVEMIPASLCYRMYKITSITIPNSVTSIGGWAFQNCTGLTSVTIGNNVASIEFRAFEGCTGLTSIEIPNSVTSIGNWAFQNCTGLTSVTIPNSVTSIGYQAFSGCSGLTSPVYNAHVFAYLPTSYSGAYTIPDGIELIAGAAFLGCSGLTSVTIPNSVTSIGDEAFYGCSCLTSIDIPNSVTSIGSSAFGYCTGLTSVTMSSIIPPTMADFWYDYEQFEGCYNLNAIYVPCGTINEYKTANRWELYESVIKYKPLPYAITTHATNGTIHVPQNVCDALELTAIPDSSYRFVQWSDGNIDNPRTIALTQDTSFTAEFIKQFKVNTNCDDSRGNIEGETGDFDYLTQLTYTAIPNYGYHFDHWEIEKPGESLYKRFVVKFSLPNSWANPSAWVWQTGSSGYWTYLSKENGMYVYRTENQNMNIIIVPNGTNWGNGQTKDLAITESCCYTISETFACYKNYDYRITVDTLTLQLSSDYNISAYFAPNHYIINDGSDPTAGKINGTGNYDYLSQPGLTAVPNYGYHFTQWSDGNTDNPRTFVLTQDTTFTAEFAYDKSGVCGKGNALIWSFDDLSKELIISGNGTLDDNYTYGLEAPTQMKKLIIDNEISVIGEGAFQGTSKLMKISFGTAIETIGNNAFRQCPYIIEIHAPMEFPPIIDASVFAECGDLSGINCYVQEESLPLYKKTNVWKDFNLHVEAGPTGIDPVTGNPSPVTQKILRNGQILILRGEKVYTVTGQEVR